MFMLGTCPGTFLITSACAFSCTLSAIVPASISKKVLLICSSRGCSVQLDPTTHLQDADAAGVAGAAGAAAGTFPRYIGTFL